MSFKIVALVLALSLAAVFVGSRLIDKSLLSAFHPSSVVPDASSTPVNHPLPKSESHAQPRIAKQSLSAGLTNEPLTTGNASEEVRAPLNEQDIAQTLKPGMLRKQVLELFGNPTLRVIETRNGKVMERFIYVDLNRQTKTIAVLENGRTVRLKTGPYLGVN